MPLECQMPSSCALSLLGVIEEYFYCAHECRVVYIWTHPYEDFGAMCVNCKFGGYILK